MDFNAIVETLKNKWPAIEAPRIEAGDPFVIAPGAQIFEMLQFLKDDEAFRFDSLMTLAGADSGRELWVVYALHSFKHRHKLLVKVLLDRASPRCDSVVSLWAVADFFEREVYDLYGIVFLNHPDLRRILNPPDWTGWPGRKDYAYPSEYHGIPTLRDDQFFTGQIECGNEQREAALKASAPAPEKK